MPNELPWPLSEYAERMKRHVSPEGWGPLYVLVSHAEKARKLLQLAGGALSGVATGLEMESGQGGELIDRMRGLSNEIGKFLEACEPQHYSSTKE